MLHPAFFRGPAARDKAFRRNAQPAPAWSCSGGLGAVHQQAILRSKIAECVPLCIACHLAAPRKATLLVSVLTVLISAWLPTRKLSRMSPLEAIRNTGELRLKRKEFPHPVIAVRSGRGTGRKRTEGTEEGTSDIHPVINAFILGFTVMLCFFTLSGISTNHTYFERYQDAWDVMVTVKDTGIENIEQAGEIRELPDVQSSIMYQKATAVCTIPETDISEEVNALGGLGAVAGSSITVGEGFYSVKAPIVIMDDAGFEEYCEQIGITPELNGSIVLNRIWDSINSNFRYKEYVPFTKGEQNTITLQNTGQGEVSLDIPVLSFTQEAPVLREEYTNYALVQFMPLAVWKEIAGQIGNTEADTYIRILGEDGITLAELNELEADVVQAIGHKYTVESENRIQEKCRTKHTERFHADFGFILCLTCHHWNCKCILEYVGVPAAEKEGICTVHVRWHDTGRHAENVLH